MAENKKVNGIPEGEALPEEKKGVSEAAENQPLSEEELEDVNGGMAIRRYPYTQA